MHYIGKKMPQIQIGGHRGGKRQTTPVYAEIDDEDVEMVGAYQWSKNNASSKHTTYAQTGTGDTKQHMHRMIMRLGNFKDDKRIINHIDGNGLNNRKSNLEICDILYNSQSFRRHHGDHNIGLVYFDTSMTRLKRWRGSIVINKIKHHKRFMTEQEAHDFIKLKVNEATS